MYRDADGCPVCGWGNVLDCPACGRSLERRRVQGFHLDLCADCRGVWFDRIELAEIWNLKVAALGPPSVARRLLALGTTVAATAADGAAELLSWEPPGGAAGLAVETVFGVAAQAVFEVAGDVIADVVASLFT